MAYRRNSRTTEAAQEWANWRKEHSALIAATALPEHVFERDNWDFFTEHGFLMESGADVKDMTVRQKVALLRIIMTRSVDLRTHVGHLLVLAILDALDNVLEQGYTQDV